MFKLGDVVTTHGVDSTIPIAEVRSSLSRHHNCDWGELCEDDKQLNVEALEIQDRLLSKYTSKDGVEFYIITEANRSCTTVLLTNEY